MSRIVKIILAAVLSVVAVLVLAYPSLMVGPGKLIPGHKHLNADCFACHAPLAGATSERCAVCHKPAEIGRLTTKGLTITKPLTPTPFHQKLVNQDCVACHSDHAGVKRFRQQGRFNHALLQEETREQCQACHKIPGDTLHQQITGNCSQCHTQEKWVPATFEHDKYFALDRDHSTRCVTCHTGNEYKRYTCYGCHEHSAEGMRREHIEEGIRKFNNCVECHRSANKHDIKGVLGNGKEKAEEGHGRKEQDRDD